MPSPPPPAARFTFTVSHLTWTSAIINVSMSYVNIPTPVIKFKVNDVEVSHPALPPQGGRSFSVTYGVSYSPTFSGSFYSRTNNGTVFNIKKNMTMVISDSRIFYFGDLMSGLPVMSDTSLDYRNRLSAVRRQEYATCSMEAMTALMEVWRPDNRMNIGFNATEIYNWRPVGKDWTGLTMRGVLDFAINYGVPYLPVPGGKGVPPKLLGSVALNGVHDLKPFITIQNFKNALKRYGPLWITLLNKYDSDPPSKFWIGSGTGYSHAVAIVGYDDAVEAFRVRNSYGETWPPFEGGNGYTWLPYKELNYILEAYCLNAKSIDNIKSNKGPPG
jgi:hypothetical protein